MEPDPSETLKGRRTRERLANMRAQRLPTAEEMLAQSADIIETLANLVFTDDLEGRRRANKRRLACVEALQFANQVRARKVDVVI